MGCNCACVCCVLQVRGEKQHTRVMKERVSCVFDDLFFFQLKGLSLEDFEDTQIKVARCGFG